MMATSDSTRHGPTAAPRDPSVALVGDDRRITYAEYGRMDGTPVVFLHGTPGSRRLGALFDSLARESGVRILAPDRPGYGRSPAWSDRSMHDATEFVLAVLDDAGLESAGIVAFSGGAPHALSTAAMCPDRVDRVDIVGGATPPGVGEDPPVAQRLLTGLATATPAVLRGLFRGQTWLARRLGPSFVVSQYTTDADAVPDDVADVVKADFIEAFAHSQRGAVTEFRGAASDWGIAFDAVDAEVTLWHGDADTNVPLSGVRRMAAMLPTAELRVVDGADHLQTLLRSRSDVLAKHR